MLVQFNFLISVRLADVISVIADIILKITYPHYLQSVQKHRQQWRGKVLDDNVVMVG